MKVTLATTMVVALLCVGIEAVKVESALQNQLSAEFSFGGFKNIIDKGAEKVTKAAGGDDIMSKVDGIKDQAEGVTNAAASGNVSNIVDQAGDIGQMAGADQMIMITSNVSGIAEAAQNSNMQGVMDQSVQSTGNIVGGDAGSQIIMGGQMVNQAQQGNIGGLATNVGQMSGNQQVQNVASFAPPAQAMVADVASGNVQGAVGTGVQNFAGNQVQSYIAPASQFVAQNIAGDASGASLTVANQANKALENISPEEAKILQDNLGAILSIQDAVEKGDVGAAVMSAIQMADKKGDAISQVSEQMDKTTQFVNTESFDQANQVVSQATNLVAQPVQQATQLVNNQVLPVQNTISNAIEPIQNLSVGGLQPVQQFVTQGQNVAATQAQTVRNQASDQINQAMDQTNQQVQQVVQVPQGLMSSIGSQTQVVQQQMPMSSVQQHLSTYPNMF